MPCSREATNGSFALTSCGFGTWLANRESLLPLLNRYLLPLRPAVTGFQRAIVPQYLLGEDHLHRRQPVGAYPAELSGCRAPELKVMLVASHNLNPQPYAAVMK